MCPEQFKTANKITESETGGLIFNFIISQNEKEWIFQGIFRKDGVEGISKGQFIGKNLSEEEIKKWNSIAYNSWRKLSKEINEKFNLDVDLISLRKETRDNYINSPLTERHNNKNEENTKKNSKIKSNKEKIFS